MRALGLFAVLLAATFAADESVVFGEISREIAAKMVRAASDVTSNLAAQNGEKTSGKTSEKTNGKTSGKTAAEAASSLLLGAPYSAAQLSPAAGPERLIAAPERPDCSTFLDYVAAAQIAAKSADIAAEEAFLRALKTWRYEGGRVQYLRRRHFFSDLAAAGLARDLLASSALAQAIDVRLNAGAAGEFIAGLGTKVRRIWVLPRQRATAAALLSLGLQSGDFVGFRREIAGLDVSHVGLILLHPPAAQSAANADESAEIWLRHASSEHSSVLDVPLLDYLAAHPKISSILLFRPLLND